MTDHELFVLKGVIAFFGFMLLLYHMMVTSEDMSVARALRYVALLSAAGAVSFASQEQIRMDVEWERRQWGGMVTAVLIVVCAIASILEDHGVRLWHNRKRG